MKRSGNVGLVLMGGAAFAATFAVGMGYFAWQKPSQAAPSATAQPAAAQPAQTCTQRPDGTQNCQQPRRGFSFYVFPSWGSDSSSAQPARQQSAAFSGSARTTTASYSTSASGVERSGFGSSAKSSFRASAGG